MFRTPNTQLIGFAGANYRPFGVALDGSNDYLSRGAEWTGNLDSKVGIFSLWIKTNGGDGGLRIVYEAGAAGLASLQHNAANKFQVDLYTSGISNILRIATSAIAAGSGWKHILASWDLAATTAHLYVNDVDDKTTLAGPTNGTIDYTATDHFIGARSGGTNKLNADVADFYFNNAAYLDFSVTANRRRFISAFGKPVYLGANGELPTGGKPICFLTGPAESFHTNRGTGGGTTVTGALANAATSPV